MSTNSKSNPLVLIIITVVVIFIAAIIYKNSNVDNSEQVTVTAVKTIKTPKINDKKEYDFKPIADVPVSSESDDTEVYKYAHLSIEERDKRVSADLHKYTNYRTPEQVMETIYKLKELGQEKEAEEYIDFLIKRFPDYEMK